MGVYLIAIVEFLLGHTTDPNLINFLVTGVYKFRLEVRRSGSTDTITNTDVSLRKDGVNACSVMAISPLWPKPPRWPIQPGTVDPDQRWVWHTRLRFVLPYVGARQRGRCAAHVALEAIASL